MLIDSFFVLFKGTFTIKYMGWGGGGDCKRLIQNTEGNSSTLFYGIIQAFASADRKTINISG
jgi:hypothetical protein